MKFLYILTALTTLHSAVFSQEIGVQLYTFRKQMQKDPAGTLQAIKNMGITKLEGGDTYGLTVAEFKKMIDEKGMKVISIGADFKKLETDVYSVIGDAKTYGAKYVVCFWIPHAEGNFTIDDARKAVEVFNTAGKLLKQKGLTLCYHAHGYEFGTYENGTLFDYLVTHMNPAYANFEMDVFWVKQPGQEPVALLQKYPGRFQLMHLKDRKPGTPNSMNGQADEESNVVLGQGDVGIDAIMKAAKKAGVKHYFIEDESSRSMEQVPQSLLYLKNLKNQ